MAVVGACTTNRINVQSPNVYDTPYMMGQRDMAQQLAEMKEQIRSIKVQGDREVDPQPESRAEAQPACWHCGVPFTPGHQEVCPARKTKKAREER